MDRSTRRLSEDPGWNAEMIYVDDIGTAVVDDLPNAVLARMLRRIMHEKSEPTQGYANFMNGPNVLIRPDPTDGSGPDA